MIARNGPELVKFYTSATMAPNKHNNRYRSKNRVSQTTPNKLVDRLTYSPKVHKQKVTRKLRQKLQDKSLPSAIPASPTPTLLFGSFNVNGLDIEASWAIDQLIDRRGYDVNSL